MQWLYISGMDDLSVLYAVFMLATGVSLGSFVTLASYRLPLGEDIVVKPSRCTNCDTKLDFFDLWPVLSWVFSKGACRHCKARVSARYPLTELATGGMFVWLYFQFGFTLLCGILCLLWVMLMIMMVVDLEHYIIPDQVHYVLIPLALAYHYVMKTSADDVVGGLLMGAGVGLVLHHGYRILRRREGLGFGDVKFFVVAGLWLGVAPFVPFLFFSGVFGIVLGLVWRAMGKGPIFPFGPALALAMFLCIVSPFYGNLFWNIGEMLQ